MKTVLSGSKQCQWYAIQASQDLNPHGLTEILMNYIALFGYSVRNAHSSYFFIIRLKCVNSTFKYGEYCTFNLRNIIRDPYGENFFFFRIAKLHMYVWIWRPVVTSQQVTDWQGRTGVCVSIHPNHYCIWNCLSCWVSRACWSLSQAVFG